MGYRYGTASSRSVRSATASARTAAATAATKALLQQLGVMSNAHCQDLATATANIWQVAELATLPQSPDASPRHSGHRAQQQERLGLTAPATRAPINTSEIEPYQEPHGLAPSGPRRKANSSGNHILGVAPPGVTDPSATHGSASSPFSSSLALAAHSAFSRRSKDNNIANNHNLNNRNAKQHRYYQQQQLDQAAATRPSSPPQQRPQQAATAATRGRNNEAFLTSSVLIPRRGAAVAKAAAAKAATSDLPADIDSSADSNLQHSKKREKEPLLNLLPNKQPLLPLSATPVARPRSRPLLPALSPALSRLAATTQRLVSTALRSLVPQPPPTAKLYRPLLTAAPSPGARPAAPSSPTSTSTMLPLSSAAGVRGGGGASLRQYHSPLTKFVWTAFASNMVLAVVFGALCATSYKVGGLCVGGGWGPGHGAGGVGVWVALRHKVEGLFRVNCGGVPRLWPWMHYFSWSNMVLAVVFGALCATHVVQGTVGAGHRTERGENVYPGRGRGVEGRGAVPAVGVSGWVPYQ